MPPRSSKPPKQRRPAGSAYEAGLRLLGRRAHAQRELQRKLGRRGFDPEEVEAALVRLARSGLLDDEAFAAGLTRRRSATRGPLAISAELASKGIDRAITDAAVRELDSRAQLEAATRVAQRLYAVAPRSAYRNLRDRIGAKLVRRGFSSGIARTAVETALAGTPGPLDL